MSRREQFQRLLWQRALKAMPGGVNSPVRSFKSVGGEPVFFQKSKGPHLYDTQANPYIDFVNSWGALILGHAHPNVVEAMHRQATDGASFGAPSEVELQLAEYIVSKISNVDQIRMVNSGTEACMSALRLARAYTKKQKVIKFEGCYHGHADPFLVSAGSGPMSLNVSDSPGVSAGAVSKTLLAKFNNINSVDRQLEAHQGEIAAIILEPVPGNMGCVLPDVNFLRAIRQRCNRQGIVLIFDEVMSGFRVSDGGAQKLYEVYADLVTFGKIIGGGLPVGAFGGKKSIMELLAPSGRVYQAGTMSGNPMVMSAGLTTLQVINDEPGFYKRIEKLTSRLKAGTEHAVQESNLPLEVNQVGSMISFHFSKDSVVDFESSSLSNRNLYKGFFHFLLEQGIYAPPSPFESWFVSAAMTEEHIDFTLDRIRKALLKLAKTEFALDKVSK